MRLFLTALSLLIFKIAFTQSSVVYKRNAFGELEVYQSQGGLPTGSALYKLKKNVWGYLEVENLKASTNPFTNRPDYSAYSTYNSYQLPTKEIFQTLDVLNKRTEYDKLIANPNTNNNSNTSELLKEAQTFMQNRSAIATSLLNFYNSNVEFPKNLKDGWYEVTKITKNTQNEASRELGFKDGYDYTLGVCRVANNRIAEYYENINLFEMKDGFVFQKINVDIMSLITNCKSSYRAKNENEYSTIYFLDNVVDIERQIPNPQFAYYSVFTAPNFNSNNLTLHIQVARNKNITRDEVVNLQGGPYILTVFKPNPVSSDCSSSGITLAFRKSTDKFSIGLLRFSDRAVWTLNDLNLTAGTCASTVLNER